MRKNKKVLRIGCLLLCSIFLLPAIVSAQSSSPNYRVEESYFGSGGSVESNSTNFKARQSTGALAVGDMSSPNYRAANGFETPSEPFLEAGIAGPDVDFGTLDPSTTSYAASQGGSCNCTFYVRSYLSSGYTVITGSQPPTSENNDVIDAKGTLGAPPNSTSVEEYGIN